MRRILLALTACLAVLAARARAEEEAALPVPAEDAAPGETVVEVDDLDDINLARMLGDLFEDDDGTDATDATDATDREPRADGGEDEKAANSESDMTRYNNFMDTVLRRLNAHSRTKFDPLSIGLTKKSSSRKGKGKKEGGSGRGGGKGKEEEGGDSKGKKKKDGKKGNKRKGGKKGGKKGKKGKGRREGRHPKDLDLEEVDVVGQDAAGDVGVEEQEAPSPVEEVRKKREADLIEEVEEEEEEDVHEEEEEEDEDMSPLARERRDVADEVVGDASTAVESSRKGKPAPKKEDGGKGRNKGKKKKKKGGKKGGKKGEKKGGKKNRKSLPRVRTSRASVTGIATLRRSGDVKVVNKDNGKEIRSQIVLGPVDLKVTRKFGFGKDALSRNAKAQSPELKGKMYIYVSADGKAKVTRFHIARPAIVKVDGNLQKATKSGASPSNNFMEKSISRVTPVATKKLRQASKEVLSASEPRT